MTVVVIYFLILLFSSFDYYFQVLFFISEELLLNRQVKSYTFLSRGAVSVDDVDDADMFKQTEVSITGKLLLLLIINE